MLGPVLAAANALWLCAAPASAPPADVKEQGTVKPQAADRPRFKDLAFASYPGAEMHPMGDEAELNGSAAALGWIQTKDSPEQVVKYYFETFEKMGLHPTGAQPAANAAYVVFRDPQDHLQHMVTIVKGEQGTYVFPSIQDPEAMLRGPDAQALLPLPPGHSEPVANTIREGGMTQQSAHTQVPMPAAKARAFYLESLKKEGWVTDDFAKGRPGSLSFRRRGSMLFLEVRETGDASCTVDYLLMQRY